MIDKKIKITCDIKSFAPIDDLSEFQGKLKTITKAELEKLKKSIIKYGFSFPIFMWQLKILDGHQRLMAVKSLIEDGWKLENNNLPVVSIKAKSEKEAAEKLLLINSRYAKMNQAGFNMFIADFNIEMGEFGDYLDIPEVSFDTIMDDDDDEEIINKENLEYKIMIDCEDEQKQTSIMQTLEEIGIECKPLIL